jgi:type VI protein secretion system component Hcp
MRVRSTIAKAPKYLAALIGFASIFGFNHSSAGIVKPSYYLLTSSTSTTEIPVTGFSYAGTSGTGGSVTVSMVVKRVVDKYSQAFLMDQISGATFGTVILHCYIPTALTVLEYKMSDCQIVSVTEDSSSGEPNEEITLGFSQITLNYTPIR